MTYANPIDMGMVPLTVRVPTTHVPLIKAYANYIRAQMTWDDAYIERIETPEDEAAIREIASRNTKKLPSPTDLTARIETREVSDAPIDKLRQKLLIAARAHYVETRKFIEQAAWMHDRTSLDAAAIIAKKIANIYMCSALIDYEQATYESGEYGLWEPKWRLKLEPSASPIVGKVT